MSANELYVNTIEFNGQKAVINSYTASYVITCEALASAMKDQFETFKNLYPKAIVRNEKLGWDETAEMVADGYKKYGQSPAHEIGKLSNGEA